MIATSNLTRCVFLTGDKYLYEIRTQSRDKMPLYFKTITAE